MAVNKLTPGMIDVDVPGWELEGEVRDCHETFSETPARDAEKAKRWANQRIGRRLVWRKVVERGFEHYEANAIDDPYDL
jgi:hypothetical protein